MPNFLEQLVREWYEYRGYFVRQNVNVGKRPPGGYECELDIVAFHPETRHLVHIEPSMDADSWQVREQRYQRKFKAGRKYIPELLAGLDIPTDIEQIALLVFASTRNRTALGGGRLMIVDEFIRDILSKLSNTKLAESAVPEQLPIIRTIQFVSEFRDVAIETWQHNAT